ncbi:protein NEGATIVE GRAVITROPIC RESPONSE OF ROOTS-like [Salvia splendens]|uniref:protein NEGATIVE GRAVITROPIC RESPONSE OF ROOTS-like n=1 Tax=Salvia splendens TaxID=180675 RepID=UPI001C25B08D|nr:protein NEGATIVE GRAVITROPIC RESPONSE OF ROOTS-like [Salvia splendens]
MKSKIHGKDNTIKPEPQLQSPTSLLSIGTFGNKIEDSHTVETSADHDQLEDGLIERELRALLNEHASNSSGESERFDLPMEKILESFPVHREVDDDEEKEEDDELVADMEAGLVERAYSTGKDRKGKCSIYRKSILFLLRKAFVCGGGFAPSPILRDPFLYANLDRSRMEKVHFVIAAWFLQHLLSVFWD